MKYRYEILEHARVFAGFLKVDRYRLKHDLFLGGESRALVRERLEELRAASVLLFDPVRDEIVLIEQFRIGGLEQPGNPWMLETIGGYIGESENPEEVARRESLEEANCVVKQLVKICDFWVSPGLSSDRIHLYCGQVDATNAAGVHGLEHEGEDIRVVVMKRREAMDELYTGRLNSTSVIIALQWLALHRQELIEKWVSPSK